VYLKRLKKRPYDYFKMFFADTRSLGAGRDGVRPQVLRRRPVCLRATSRSIPRKARSISARRSRTSKAFRFQTRIAADL
jgi:hypothetical protein